LFHIPEQTRAAETIRPDDAVATITWTYYLLVVLSGPVVIYFYLETYVSFRFGVRYGKKENEPALVLLLRTSYYYYVPKRPESDGNGNPVVPVYPVSGTESWLGFTFRPGTGTGE